MMQWKYVTPLDVLVCMERLSDLDIGSVDELNPFRVEIMRIADAHVYLVYKGRRFSKGRRTEYLLSVLPAEASSGANITVVFKGELFNLPYPITPISELDAFLKLTLNAYRID